jgi:flagellar biosynthesis protein FlhF
MKAKAKPSQPFKPAVAQAYQTPEQMTRLELQTAVRQALANAKSANAGARTFQAGTVAEALDIVQRELGPEALVVSVRQVPGGAGWQVWRKPRVEVVAMPTVKGGRAAAPELPALNEAGPLVAPGTPEVSQPIEAAPSPAAGPAYSGPLLDVQRALAAHGLAEELIQKVTANCAATLSPRALEDRARVREHIARQLEAGLRIWPSTALTTTAIPGQGPKVVCVVGASGSGKTTTLGKIAAHHTRTEKLRVAWVSADTIRAGAIAQARVYADALKLPFRVVYSGADLARAIVAERDTDLILVDTPGCNPRRKADVIELLQLLGTVPGRHTYLAAPATAKDADLADMCAAFGTLDLKGLLLTKLDETSTLGSVVNLAWRSRLPMVYFTTGPGALDELHPASAGALVGGLMP